MGVSPTTLPMEWNQRAELHHKRAPSAHLVSIAYTEEGECAACWERNCCQLRSHHSKRETQSCWGNTETLVCAHTCAALRRAHQGKHFCIRNREGSSRTGKSDKICPDVHFQRQHSEGSARIMSLLCICQLMLNKHLATKTQNPHSC